MSPSLTATTTTAPATVFPPGPPTRRGGVLGNLGYYIRFIRDPIGFVSSRFDTYGDIYHVNNPDGHLYVLRHPDHLRDVLLSRAADYRKTHTAFDRLAVVLGNGLLNSDGDTWKRHRRMIQPAFHPTQLAEYAHAMSVESADLAERWRRGGELEMSREMMVLTLRVVSRTLFSHDVSGETDRVGEAMTTFQDAMTTPDILPEWLPSPARRRIRAAVATLDEIILGLISARRADIAAGKPGRPDLLQRLVAAADDEGDGGSLTEREVRDELVTLFLAGHETTSNALTWTWYLLSQNPRVERTLHEELDRVLGGRPASYDDLDRLPYTEQVIKEAMRMYPPAYLVGRRAAVDTEIGGFAVPAGSEVVLWIYRTHHDPRWFPQPEQFRPERFAPDAEAALPKLAYLPFGAGSRACIGKMFSMMEATIILANLAQNVRAELVPGQRVLPRPRITLGVKNGLRMRVFPR